MRQANDKDLLQVLNEAASDAGMSVTAFIELGRAIAKWRRYAFVWPEGPFPRVVDEVELSEETLAQWPEWVRGLVSVGPKWERLHWPDGSFTVRLVTSQALVLAATHFTAEDAERTWKD